MMILVSSCLLGVRCRYDGGCEISKIAIELLKRHMVLPVCPEQLGGMETPRVPCEINGSKVNNLTGEDRTETFNRGVSEALSLACSTGVSAAFLKEKSPSCGVSLIYDGLFSGKLIPGQGLLTRALLADGVPVFSSDRDSDLRDFLNDRDVFF